jgi:hypothetical protein
LLILASAGAQAATHVCETKRAYTLEAGELRPYREEMERMSWKTVIFDDATGVLKYGHEARTETMPEALPEAWRKMNQPYWVEEKLVVTSRGESISFTLCRNCRAIRLRENRQAQRPPQEPNPAC